jgi:hypothetical protein
MMTACRGVWHTPGARGRAVGDGRFRVGPHPSPTTRLTAPGVCHTPLLDGWRA